MTGICALHVNIPLWGGFRTKTRRLVSEPGSELQVETFPVGLIYQHVIYRLHRAGGKRWRSRKVAWKHGGMEERGGISVEKVITLMLPEDEESSSSVLVKKYDYKIQWNARPTWMIECVIFTCWWTHSVLAPQLLQLMKDNVRFSLPCRATDTVLLSKADVWFFLGVICFI